MAEASSFSFSSEAGVRLAVAVAAASGQGDPAPDPPSKGGKGSLRGGGGRGGGSSGSAFCQACDRPKKSGSSLCVDHKRGYDTIYRACSTADSKGTADDGEWGEELQCYAGSNFYIFQKVFGRDDERRKGFKDPRMALKVIIDFVRDNPGGKDKRKVRKFAVNMTKYWRVEGTRQECMHEEGYWKIDEEMFFTEMKTKRGWDPSKSQAFWKQWEADPDMKDKRDNNGPPWS